MKALFTVIVLVVVMAFSATLASAATSKHNATKNSAATLKSQMLRIDKLAWTAPGKPSKNYPQALVKLNALSPEISALGDEVLAIIGKKKVSTLSKTERDIKNAAKDLKKQSKNFTFAFKKQSVRLPPRLERAVQDAIIGALTTLQTLLPKI